MVLEPARRGIDHQSEQLHRSQLARVVSGSSHPPGHGQSRAARCATVVRVRLIRTRNRRQRSACCSDRSTCFKRRSRIAGWYSSRPHGSAHACRVRVASAQRTGGDRKSTRLNSSHLVISYAVFCLKKKKNRKG